jgi:hypothetical protein
MPAIIQILLLTIPTQYTLQLPENKTCVQQTSYDCKQEMCGQQVQNHAGYKYTICIYTRNHIMATMHSAILQCLGIASSALAQEEYHLKQAPLGIHIMPGRALN